MKYLIRVLLTGVMMVSLCACGGGQDNTTQAKAADINGDGSINAIDTNVLKRILAGFN